MQMYALSTPVSALIGFSLLRLFCGPVQGGKIGYGVGLILLFAMGTLLYVITMQILPEVFSQTHEHFEIPVQIDVEQNHHHHHDQ